MPQNEYFILVTTQDGDTASNHISVGGRYYGSYI